MMPMRERRVLASGEGGILVLMFELLSRGEEADVLVLDEVVVL